MKNLSAALFAVAVVITACGAPVTSTPTDGGTGIKLDTAERIGAYLEGKTLTMDGANIPSHPNGFNENQNFNASSQCYQNTIIKVAGSNYTVTAALAKIKAFDGGVPAALEVGICDKAVSAGVFGPTTSMVVKYDNVKGNAECFDIDVNFGVYAQEGRGSIADGGIALELFFSNQSVKNRCVDGNVGSGSVMRAMKLPDGGVVTSAFVGNAVQRYVITQ